MLKKMNRYVVTFDKTKHLILIVLLVNLTCIGIGVASHFFSTASASTMILAYFLGVRHGFDADHIAVIDNTIRRLGTLNKDAVFSGFFFALGHSSVVFIGTFLVYYLSKSLPEVLSGFAHYGATIATLVSITLLLWLGLSNIFSAVSKNRTSSPGLTGPNVTSGRSSLLGSLFNKITSKVQSSFSLFPIGMLFGLSFETATEIALLTIAANSGLTGATLLEIIIYPCLFMSGMLVVDSVDGLLMLKAYKWANKDGTQRINYNYFISILTGVIAVSIAFIQMLYFYFGESQNELVVASLIDHFYNNSEIIGAVIFIIFLITWTGSVCLSRYRLRKVSS